MKCKAVIVDLSGIGRSKKSAFWKSQKQAIEQGKTLDRWVGDAIVDKLIEKKTCANRSPPAGLAYIHTAGFLIMFRWPKLLYRSRLYLDYHLDFDRTITR